MPVLEKARELDEHLSESSWTYRAKEILDAALPVVLVILMATLYYEFFTALNPAQHQIIVFTQRVILLYFIAELVIDLGIYQSNQRFLQERWLDIVLILPFFTAIRSYGAAMKGLKGTKAAKGLTSSTLLKGLKPSKTVKGLKTAQHSTKTVTKLRELVSE